VPLMGKVKQAKMAHKMTKGTLPHAPLVLFSLVNLRQLSGARGVLGLTWRQRWKLFKCYRKLSKLCSCCCASS
jgi:hypothetical protein